MVASHHSVCQKTSSQRPNSILRLFLYFFILYFYDYQSKKTFAEGPTNELCCEIQSFINLSSVLLQSKIDELLFRSNMSFTSLVFMSFSSLRSHLTESSLLLKMDL